jgi:DNA-binding response OmpR family regulator
MASPSILVANDDEVYLEMIQDLLTEAGYRRVLWHAGAGAFQRIRDEQPALLLLDINLSNPGHGWQTLNAVKLHPKTTHIPVILCSTDRHLFVAKVEMLRSMQCEFLEKPFDIETLLDKIASVIGPPASTS